MPRSKIQISADNAARARCKEIIKVATRNFTGNLDAQSIVQIIQSSPKTRAKIEADKPLLRYLWREGMKLEIRAALKEWGLLDPDGEGPPQLELFPEHEIPLVRKIGRARIWLPRAQAHVQYHDLPEIDLNDAADYYERHANGELLLALHLRELAVMRRPDAPQRAAA